MATTMAPMAGPMDQPLYHADAHSPTGQKRQRAKQACEPCRLRKRRCNGDLPCNMCVKFEYNCYFEKHSRKRSKIVEKDAAENGIISSPDTNSREAGIASQLQADMGPKPERAAPEEILKLRSMEANSGIAFTRLLGMKLDASAGPKLFTFGWNLGSVVRTQPITRAITELLSLEQMVAMAKLYFQNVHPLYGFLDQNYIMEQLVARYKMTEQLQHCPDHIFQGIAVLGAMFAPGVIDDVVPELMESAKLSLESTSILQPPTLCDVQAWILRVIYLRFSGHPHSCWMATNTTMHLIDCLGIHLEQSNSSVIYSATQDQRQDPEGRRRTFWVARLFNTWVSFEYGRSRVTLRGITCPLPEARDNDFTREYVSLYCISCCLDPELLDKPGQWEDFLQQLGSFNAGHECITLSKANLALCAYRRLRLGNPNLPLDTVNRIISLALGGLKAARSLATRHMPWWHVANVPFQTICCFLAIDTKESLSHIAHAMRVFDYVAEAFPSPSMKEALKTSRFLVRLAKRKKDQDSELLGQSLLKDGPECDPRPENLVQSTSTSAPNGSGEMSVIHPEDAPLTTSSAEEWSLDFLNHQDFDWNFFLGQDIPAFQNLAPDGMM